MVWFGRSHPCVSVEFRSLSELRDDWPCFPRLTSEEALASIHFERPRASIVVCLFSLHSGPREVLSDLTMDRKLGVPNWDRLAASSGPSSSVGLLGSRATTTGLL